MKTKSVLLFLSVALLCACGGTTPTTLTNDQPQQDTIPVTTVIVEREMASADMTVFGGIQFGRVRSITTDDLLAETPEIRFDEQGHLVATKPAEVIIRDKQGRVANHNGGKLDKDTMGFLFRTTYQYEGETNRVKWIRSDNTVNKLQSVNYRRFNYEGDKVYPAEMFELLLSGQWPAANYSTYEYKDMDDQGNWLSREVKNYYFERPDFLSPEVMNQLDNEEAMQAAEKLLKEHVQDATPTTYTESRTIEYYE